MNADVTVGPLTVLSLFLRPLPFLSKSLFSFPPFLQLTDFGLARFYHSVTRSSGKDSEEEGGTISYMPPEAFDLSYRPARASDIYRYEPPIHITDLFTI